MFFRKPFIPIPQPQPFGDNGGDVIGPRRARSSIFAEDTRLDNRAILTAPERATQSPDSRTLNWLCRDLQVLPRGSEEST
ncbi:hypothetical protein JOB18_041505 [Solea senegalensis]|uniref:Uncharacterized protein n=1 Tax=Solea senegalensis TaxID=28829 RepID=A0AAV6SCJ7_SOLSE|nr:hypothetical protein JOB18_041505 [Solea senegalensis]